MCSGRWKHYGSRVKNFPIRIFVGSQGFQNLPDVRISNLTNRAVSRNERKQNFTNPKVLYLSMQKP
jgi:hypothetical protein